jgi:hypothetical protein
VFHHQAGFACSTVVILEKGRIQAKENRRSAETLSLCLVSGPTCTKE